MRVRLLDLPLRVQLVVIVTSLVTISLVATGIASTSALRGYLLDRVDAQLMNTARDQMQHGGPMRGGGDSDDFGGGPALAAGYYSQVIGSAGAGQPILRVPAGSNQSAPKLPSLGATDIERLANHPFTVPPVEDGAAWRILVMTQGSSQATVTGTDLSDVENTVSRLRSIQLGVGAIVLLVLAFTGYGLVRSRLRRLVEVERTAEKIAAGDLSQRVPNAGGRTEVGHLGASVNKMLEQIESSFAAQQESESSARASEQRMRRFVADASHELRTPLTSIRGFAELHRQNGGNGEVDTGHLLGRIEGEAKRMGVLVDDLLLLARLDQHRPLEQINLDLTDVVTDAVENATVATSTHEVRFVNDADPDHIEVTGDEMRLRQVLANLLNNACTHTPPGTHVSVELRTDGDYAVVEVIDDGPGMEPADAERVFERFYRADPSRTRASGGSGLGLSIVQGIVAAHDGEIALDTSPGNGTKFTVRLPRTPRHQGDAQQ